MQSNLMFDFSQAEDSLNNVRNTSNPQKWATDALIRFAKIKGHIERLEDENQWLRDRLREKIQ